MVRAYSSDAPYAPLRLAHHNIAEDIEEPTDISDLEHVRTPRLNMLRMVGLPIEPGQGKTYRILTCSVALLGITVFTVVAMVCFSKNNGGQTWARVQSSTRLSDGTCQIPEGFCVGTVRALEMVDCDADGIQDPYCKRYDRCSCIGSASKCEIGNWYGCLPARVKTACPRPVDWCSGGKEYIYSTMDCDGDGQTDPFCQRTDSDSGEVSCGCIQSANNCFDNWPAICPSIIDDTLTVKTISLKDGQSPIVVPVDGSLAYMYKEEGDSVYAGERVATVLNGSSNRSKIIHLRSKTAGTIEELLPLHSGDNVTSNTVLAAVAPPKPGARKPGRGKISVVPLLTTTEHVPVLDTTEQEPSSRGKVSVVPVLATEPSSTTTSTPPFEGLPVLPGPGEPVGAMGFAGIATFKSWGDGVHVDHFVKSGQTLATIDTNTGEMHVKVEDDGVIAKLAKIKPGDRVNVRGQLAKIALAKPAANFHVEPGLKKLKCPVYARLVKWSVDESDKLDTGETAAVVNVNGVDTPVIWDEPNGMVLKRAALEPGDIITKDADLLLISRGLVLQWFVNLRDEIKERNVAVCEIKVAGHRQNVSGGPGVVLHKSKLITGDWVGFGEKPCPITLGRHLADLTIDDSFNASDVRAPNGQWMQLKTWKVDINAKVEAGTKIAVARPYLPDGSLGNAVDFQANRAGYIVSKQSINPGDIIGGGDVLVLVGNHSLLPPSQPSSSSRSSSSGSGWFWWILFLLILICLACLIPPFLYSKPEEPVVPPPPQSVRELTPEPTAAPELVAELVAEPVAEPVEENPLPVWMQRVVEPPALPPGVSISFDGKPFYFQYKPLGIWFWQKAPIKIESFPFNSYGKTLGLEKGMRLTQIGNEDVHENHKYSDVHEKLLDAVRHLPFWPLRVDFKTQEGEIKNFYFLERPLGLLFDKKLPIKVAQFKGNGIAQQQGVQIGWEIVRIADESEVNTSSFDKVNKSLLEGLKHLPERKGGRDRKSVV